MKYLALLILALALPLRADILVNSNFTDGRAHWKGDMVDSDTASADAATLSISSVDATSSGGAGVVIKLKKDKWTKIYQTFSIRDPKLYYSLTFQLSPDYKLASKDDQDTSTPDLGNVYAWGGWPMPMSEWCIMISGPTLANRYFTPNSSKRGEQQTVTGSLNDLPTDSDATVVLLFPPGEGSVTFYNFSLSRTPANSQP